MHFYYDFISTNTHFLKIDGCHGTRGTRTNGTLDECQGLRYEFETMDAIGFKKFSFDEFQMKDCDLCEIMNFRSVFSDSI